LSKTMLYSEPLVPLQCTTVCSRHPLSGPGALTNSCDPHELLEFRDHSRNRDPLTIGLPLLLVRALKCEEPGEVENGGNR
jgi:hypothetical protein